MLSGFIYPENDNLNTDIISVMTGFNAACLSIYYQLRCKKSLTSLFSSPSSEIVKIVSIDNNQSIKMRSN